MASSLRFNRAVLGHIARRLASRRRTTLPGKPPRKAAVMLPLCNVDGAASCLFTKRTEEVGTHKGQVSFPGGHVDSGETSIDAARRELVEELGGAAASTTVLGKFDQALAITGTHVTPVVGFLGGDVSDLSVFELSAAEVDFAFTLPFEMLLDPANVSLQTLTSRQFRSSTVPVFGGGPATVWGLTAYILAQVMHDVVVPSFVDAGQLPPTAVKQWAQVLTAEATADEARATAEEHRARLARERQVSPEEERGLADQQRRCT